MKRQSRKNDNKTSHNGKTWLFFVTAFLGMLVIFLAFERNRVFFGGIGNIEKGEKFGISIGEKRTISHERLNSLGFEQYELGKYKNPDDKNDNSCHGRVYTKDIVVEAFTDKSWRGGTLCLASKDGIIVSLSWDYGFVGP